MSKKKIIKAKYEKYSNKGYHFRDETGKELLFNKCDRSIIVQFDLQNENIIEQWFEVEFWEIEPSNDPFSIPLKIITNLIITQ